MNELLNKLRYSKQVTFEKGFQESLDNFSETSYSGDLSFVYFCLLGQGNIQMNAPKKSAHRSEEEQKCGFNRVSSGGSFSVQGVPEGSHADIFPPCKIIDLEAVKVEEEVTLSWTAPGEDFDQGQGRFAGFCI